MLSVHIHLLSDLAFGGVFHVQWSTRKRSQCPKIIREVCQYLDTSVLLSSAQAERLAHTHYLVFSLMVFLTFLYQNHYRHPSTLSIEYEEMRTPASNISRFWYKVNNSVWGWQQQWRGRGWEVSNLRMIEGTQLSFVTTQLWVTDWLTHSEAN